MPDLNQDGAPNPSVRAASAATAGEAEPSDPAVSNAAPREGVDLGETMRGLHPQNAGSSCKTRGALWRQPDTTNVPRRRSDQTKLSSTLAGMTVVLLLAMSCVVVGAASAGFLGPAGVVQDIVTNALSAVLGAALTISATWCMRALQAKQKRSSTPRTVSPAKRFQYHLAKRWFGVKSSSSAPTRSTSPVDSSAYNLQLIYHEVSEELCLAVDSATGQARTSSAGEYAQVDALPAIWKNTEQAGANLGLADQVAEYLDSSAAINVWLDHVVDKNREALRRSADSSVDWVGSTSDDEVVFYQTKAVGHRSEYASNVPDLVRHNLEHLVRTFFTVTYGAEPKPGPHFALVNPSYVCLRYHSDTRFVTGKPISPILLWSDGDGGWAVARETPFGDSSVVTHLTDPRSGSVAFENVLRAVVELSGAKMLCSSDGSSRSLIDDEAEQCRT
jgi:hypothetical protein